MLNNGKINLIYTEVEFTMLYPYQALFHHIANYLEKKRYNLHSIYNLSYDRRNGQLLYGDAISVLKNN